MIPAIIVEGNYPSDPKDAETRILALALLHKTSVARTVRDSWGKAFSDSDFRNVRASIVRLEVVDEWDNFPAPVEDLYIDDWNDESALGYHEYADPTANN